MADSYILIQEPASSSATKFLDAESVVFGTTTVYRERMQVAGAASGAIAAVTSADPASTVFGLGVRLIDPYGGSSGKALHVTPTTTVPISGNATVSPAAGTTFNIAGNATAVVANSSGGITTANPLAVYLQSSTATVSVQGNTTAILTTGSKVQVEPVAGAVFPISGNSTALVANSSGAIASGNPLHVFVQGSTATVSIQGNATAILTTGSKVQVEPIAGSTFNIAGNATAVVANSSGAITTANPLAVLLQGSTATVSIQGNTTAILTTGSKVQVEPIAGSTFNVAGNATVSPAAGTTWNVAGGVSAVITTGSRIQVEFAASAYPYGDPANATYVNKTFTASGTTAFFTSQASKRFNITNITFVNKGATGTVVELYSGGSATMLWRSWGASGGGGAAPSFPVPLRSTTGEKIDVYLSGGTTAYLHMSGFLSS